MSTLPTQRQMFEAARDALQKARNQLTEAQLEVKGDWQPLGSSLTDAGADARKAVLTKTSQLKNEIDDLFNVLDDAIREQRS
ncbi:hypothetical protein [Nocardia tengchongensis]|uniref:hypothetical protein n=1 Tax=Nocardia tengchongensis TaxID=2055889 RepID=UPI003618ECFF